MSSKRFLSSKVMVVVSAIAILFYFSGTVMAAQSTQLNYNTASTSDGNSYYNGNKKPLVLKSIALLPMENLSGAPIAPEVVREYIKRELKNKGWVLISRDDIVEEFLAKRRVRYTGAITRLVVREMGKALGVDAVMVGSVNYYTGSGTSVMVGVSCRLLSTTDGSIIWADNLAYTGRDYQGFLGLGAVKSLDILASMVVKDLVSSIADKFFIRDTALSPFEIERVITYPNISKVGDVVEIRVKILPLYEAPTQVRAMIQGEEHILEKISDSEYRGLIYAPESEGTYMVDVMAMDRTMIPFTFNSAGKVVVDSTAPEIEIDVSTKIFSPRNRGSVKIDTRLLRVEEIEEWRFTIYDEKGQRIKSERGFGELPGRIIWKGETDWRMLVDDGHY
ncbi:MAG: hypothetical protein KAR06_08835, partial [Deltaproteobacteria bacterium]|nr:hypothetical protein [Deltaproteobacteria bacterium]